MKTWQQMPNSRRRAIIVGVMILFFVGLGVWRFWSVFGPAIRHSYENPVTTVETRSDIDALPSHVDRLATPTLNDTDLEYLSKKTSVSQLDLSDNANISNDGLRHVARIKRLEHLSLGRTSVTDAGIRHLRKVPLTYINLWHTGIGDKSLDYLAEEGALKQLQIKGCNRVTDKGVAKLKNLRNLWMVNLSQCSRITDKSIQTLSSMPSVRFIQVFNCPNVSESATDRFLDAGPDREVHR